MILLSLLNTLLRYIPVYIEFHHPFSNILYISGILLCLYSLYWILWKIGARNYFHALYDNDAFLTALFCVGITLVIAGIDNNTIKTMDNLYHIIQYSAF